REGALPSRARARKSTRRTPPAAENVTFFHPRSENMTLTQGPPWQTYRVSGRGDGSTTVRIRTGDGLAAKEAIRRTETCLEFATLEQALECAGTSRISAAGVIVTVMVDGEERIG